ncbi:MAG: hypothetical protein AAF480_02705 [Actinomycetota bacterium]
MTLLVSACSVELGVEVLDPHGNPTVVPVNGETVAMAEAAVEGARGAGVDAAVDEQPDQPTPSRDTAEPTVTPASDPEAEPTATPVPADDAPAPTVEPTPTSSTPDPTPTPADASGDTSSPTATPSPTPTPAPTATPEPVEIEFVIGPDAPLLGVAVGSDATAAMASLATAIGEPDFDSGWYVGCPLDGDALDERLVQWGDLNVYFDRSDGAEVMRAWGYDLRIVDGGFPELEMIELPGGARMGDPVNEVAAAAGLEVRYDDLFDINRVGESGYEILADAPPGAPVWGVFVPGIPTCE